MTVTDSTTKSHYCIEVGNWLHVYGQNGGTGELTVENEGSGGGIFSDALTINGGHIKSKAQGTALNALSAFTINDGVVTAESLKGFGIGCGEEFGNGNVSLITINGGVVKATSNTSGKNGLYVAGGRVAVIEIYGGQVESNSINSYKDIVLGYTNASDYITSGSYSGTVRIANDQTMTDGTSTYSGQLSSAQKEALAGKTLRPFNVVSVDYIDAEGNTRTATAIALSGTEASLGFEDQQRWYVVNSDISYDHQVELNGNVYLILCDGKTMTMTETDANKQCLRGLWVDGSNLTIYGQSGGTGALTATNNNGRAIYTNRLTINGGHITASAEAQTLYANNLTINGGHITASAESYALSANSVLTINGGVVKATTTAEGSYGFCASGAEEACVVINGGQVETSGIECSSGTVTLGYSYADDYIKCDKFSHPYIQIAEGKTMTDGTSTYSGQLSPEQKEALAGKTLRPYFAESPNITLVQGTKDGVSCYWGTFYSIQRYTIPEGAAAYTMGSDYKLYRLGTDGGVIPAGVAVVIISKTAGNTPTMTITLDKSDDTSEVTVNGGGNILRGSDGVIEVTDGKVTVGDQQKTPYVLSVKNGTVDFYPLSSDFNSSIPAHKAYYIQ